MIKWATDVNHLVVTGDGRPWAAKDRLLAQLRYCDIMLQSHCAAFSPEQPASLFGQVVPLLLIVVLPDLLELMVTELHRRFVFHEGTRL